MDNINNINHGSKNDKSSYLSIGASIIYGTFLFLIGVFLSLETFAGRMGSNRIISTVKFKFSSNYQIKFYFFF
jgi:hypothetical protein